MKVYHSSKEFPKTLKNPVIALGNFDGVHRAHQTMFRLAKQLAKKIKGHAIAYTFDPHPVKVLAEASAPLMINTLEQKLELLQSTGIHGVVLEPFEKRLAHMEAEAWFSKILLGRLHAKGVVAGYDFTFGQKRSGTADTLQSLCQDHGVHCEILEAQLFKETLISSTQIRQFISRGDLPRANQLLGRPFFIDGEVIQGMGRGNTLGIPTANLKVLNELLPSRGVYACQTQVGNKTYSAVTNIGMNPTFGGQTLSIETHLLGFKQNIYGKKLRLAFLKKIRDEQTFASVQTLVKQIQQDIEHAKKILKT